MCSSIWGATPIPRAPGNRYYIHFVDDYTNFTWICPLKQRSEVIVTFKQFKIVIEKSLNKSIQCVQID